MMKHYPRIDACIAKSADLAQLRTKACAVKAAR